jgi:SpoVK/Ycf46/Vps4 family AAA+-type ATPase
VEDISDTKGEEIVAASSTTLPSAELQGLWDSLIYETKLKEDLLRYIQTSLCLAEKMVDPLLVGVNRVVLLHGPPGTGKTSLCRALAQKLTIRVTQSNRFDDGVLMEINSHSLFSKWFSESGKLVQKMFDEIKRKVSNPRTFVCVLIDEVESLTSARKNSMSGLECSDAVRVVNALLTEIDKIKQHPNVLILTTSNITGSIDLAFVDRADIKQYVGPPTQAAIYQIYLSAIQELMGKGVISSFSIMNYTGLKMANMTTTTRAQSSSSLTQSSTLWRLAELSSGFSGRTLRKIPFHALALFSKLEKGMDVDLFLVNLGMAVDNQTKEREELNNSLNTA